MYRFNKNLMFCKSVYTVTMTYTVTTKYMKFTNYISKNFKSCNTDKTSLHRLMYSIKGFVELTVLYCVNGVVVLTVL